MGGKKNPNEKNNKTVVKEKEKKLEDLTFGLKNKNKSKNVQKFVQSLGKNLNVKDDATKQLENRLKNQAEEKKKADLELLASLGQAKGSNNNNKQEEVEYIDEEGNKRTGKMDIYKDQRDNAKDERDMEETNENWDQEMLEKVINTKHGHRKAKTDKICRFFIDAIEKQKQGWFWKCPNGEECIQRHALPEGWRLRESALGSKKELTLEEVIEKERGKLTGELTPLNKELFEAWKEKWLARMKQDKENLLKKDMADKKKDKKQLDPNFKFLSGRSMFVYNPTDELEDEGEEDNELQELIKNRKHYNLDDEDKEEGEDDYNDVELPDEDDDELLNVQLPDDDEID